MDGVLKPFARSYYQSSNPVLKTVIKVNLCDGKAKQKAMKTVAAVSGVDFIAIDMNEKLLTVIGTVNPLTVVKKLRKYWHADIATAGAPVEAPAWDIVNGYYPPAASNYPYKPVSYYPYNHVPHSPYAHVSNYPSYPTYYNPVVSMEENPNACAIC